MKEGEEGSIHHMGMAIASLASLLCPRLRVQDVDVREVS